MCSELIALPWEVYAVHVQGACSVLGVDRTDLELLAQLLLLGHRRLQRGPSFLRALVEARLLVQPLEGRLGEHGARRQPLDLLLEGAHRRVEQCQPADVVGSLELLDLLDQLFALLGRLLASRLDSLYLLHGAKCLKPARHNGTFCASQPVKA